MDYDEDGDYIKSIRYDDNDSNWAPSKNLDSLIAESQLLYTN